MLDAHHPLPLIVPLTTNLLNNAEPLCLRVAATDRLRRDSDLLIDQLRAIDQWRLVQDPMAKLSSALMTRVHEVLADVLNLDRS